jgi:hypothetical protein
VQVREVEGERRLEETGWREEGLAFVVAEEFPVAEVGFGELAGPG